MFTGTLETLPGIVQAAAPKPPTLIIVGEVVKLHESLAWFEPAKPVGPADSEAAASRASV